ncbi:FadR/GntR family transcriptional regulator [Sphingomonas sp. DG1-23]|uniref:FadR/GntR family transcriptional regulator n=1 Tax=Sphingomonas sp. DG1-23 TaxID=3068316 RepID=UPI00273EBD07|nr:FadR/GntR family transcriptional regulator [Sphingomonas sp. DG1-23]MDP5277309.1 FadR/GntR family transcriptional regulator [Sphingomonas sp. DG1-23]
MSNNYPELGAEDARPQLGRNLTYGMLDSLGRAIVTGRYEREAFPTEAELAKQHGVSRSVTREAVKMLTAKGLLSARPRQGTVVQPATNWNLFDTDVLRWLLERQFSVELLRQFNQLRVAIEPEAAALAARVGTLDDLARISHGLERMEAAEQGLEDTLEADIAFHVAILRASGNPFYAQFRDVVGTALRTSIRFTNRLKGRTANVADHAAVRDAIAAHDSEGARTAMRALIGDVLELIDDVEAGETQG